jgi:hypothetical protein
LNTNKHYFVNIQNEKKTDSESALISNAQSHLNQIELTHIWKYHPLKMIDPISGSSIMQSLLIRPFFCKQPLDNPGNLTAKILFSRSNFFWTGYAKIIFSHSRLSPRKYYFRAAISLNL